MPSAISIVASATQRGKPRPTKRSPCQASRPPMNGMRMSQSRIMRSASQENDGGDHGHRAGRHRAGVPAQLAGLRVRELGVQRQSQTGDKANGLIGDIATIDADEEQIRLKETIVVKTVDTERRATPAETPTCEA